MHKGPVVPLSFVNAMFCSFGHSAFRMVPAFWSEFFKELSFMLTPQPIWSHSEYGTVIAPCLGELVRQKNGQEIVESWNGWYLNPEWLRSSMTVKVPKDHYIVRFWRSNTENLKSKSKDTEVTYGIEVVNVL